MYSSSLVLYVLFQSTRPRGARPGRHQRRFPPGGFNPRAREGRDICSMCRFCGISMFQSTRPRGARHELDKSPVTRLSFNPRAREGRDAVFRLSDRPDAGFNPRAREGRDLKARSRSLAEIAVSIHAPARGATRAATRQTAQASRFQSTRPRGARPKSPKPFACRNSSFNPRAREGRDCNAP